MWHVWLHVWYGRQDTRNSTDRKVEGHRCKLYEYMGNLFFSYDLFSDLTDNKFNCCRAVRSNRKEYHWTLLIACFLLVSWLTYSSTLKTEAVDFYQTIWRYFPEDRTPYIPEESTHKDLFCMFPAGKSGVIPRKPAYRLPSRLQINTI
jgi:hypothetical protein